LEERTVPSTFHVNTLTDTGNGSGDTGDLRYAINQSNATNGPNTIVFDSGATGTLSLAGHLPPITNDVTIQGPGENNLLIDGGHLFHPFTIAAGVNATISGLAITNARATPFWQTNSPDPDIQQLVPSNQTHLALDFQVHLTILINGQRQLIPANIGVTNDGLFFHRLNTRDTLGILHVEDPVHVRTFHLHDFFDVWGQAFTAHRILNYNLGGNGRITMTVNGAPNTTFGDLVLADNQNIVIQANNAVPDIGISNVLGLGGAIFNAGNLTLQDSLLVTNQALQGGAIYNTGSLTITGTQLSANAAISNGGGIFTTTDSTVSIANSTLNANHGLSGGGIYNSGGDVTITFTTLRGNLSNSGNDDIGGAGALYNFGGTATISNSLLAGNSTTHFGGAIYSNAANVTITNTTLSGNTADSTGGAIFNDASSTLSLTSATVADNTTSGQTGGIFTGTTSNSAGSASLSNSIIAKNTRNGTSDDVAGVFVSQGFNLIGNATNASGFVDTDLTGTSITPLDPLLGPLADNGGPTLTYSLLPDSPAIGAGDPSLEGTTDQRGVVRSGPTSIGAFQAIPGPTATISPVSTPRSTPAGVVTITFSAAVTGVTITPFSLTRDGTNVSLAGLTVNQVDPSTYTLDLTSVTATPGNYVFKLTAAGSGIVDASSMVPLAGDASISFQVTTSPPTARISPVVTPRTTPAGVVTITFSEAVTGVSLAPFSLTRNGVNVDLTGLTVTQVTPSQYTIDLTSVTATPGAYVFTLTAAGSGIQDANNVSLVDDASISFQVTAPVAPTATISPVTTPRTTPAGVVTITFSSAVTGVTLTPFSLTRDGVSVSLAGLIFTQVTPSQYTIDLTSVTATPGSYVFKLTAAGSGIVDASSMTPLAADASISFQVTTAPTATISPVTTPRTTPAGVVTITFSSAVTGVTLTPFSLTRDGVSVSLNGLTVTQVTPSRYTIDLTSVTATSGAYVFKLTAAGSGIVDAARLAPLAGDASVSFQVTITAPTASISPVSTPRTTPAGVVTITFSSEVTGVTLAAFSLTRNGFNVPLTGLTVTQVTPSQYTIDLTNPTSIAGAYVFTLTAAGSGIVDAATLVPLAGDASISFQVTVTTGLHIFAEPGVFDPVMATWYLRDSKSSGFPDGGTFAYGLPNWKPVAGDFTGNHQSTIGVVDPSGFRDYRNRRDAFWFLGSANGVNDIQPFPYGFAAWTPIAGDWAGSGKYGIGTFDPTTATFYLRSTASAGAPDAGVFQFGAPGWIPLAGDWTGSGKFGIGVFDPTTATFYLRNELSAGAPDAGVIQFGLQNWKPVVGDWSGSGRWTIGVVDPSGARDTINHRDAFWFLSNDNSTVGFTPFPYGFAAWTPVSGDWNFSSSALGARNRTGSAGLGADELQTAVTAALAQLRDANVAVSLLDRLSRVQFGVGVLGGGLLSQIDAGGQQVIVDATAAGQGWSVAGTAGQDGRIDLLGVVFADLGHVARQDGVEAVTVDSLGATSHLGPLGSGFWDGV
jgi:hypothetical protein